MIKFARRYQGHGLPLGDLVQEAMLGLIRAAEKFDWRRGYKFSTYAVLWIKQSIQRGLDNTGRPVRIPAHIAQRERTVNRVTTELATSSTASRPTRRSRRRPKLPLDEVMAIRDLTRVTTSLDPPVGEGDTTLGELLAESTADLEDEVLEREQEQAVEDGLAKLPEDERRDHRGPLRHRWPRGSPHPRGRPRGRGHPGRRPASSRPAPAPALDRRVARRLARRRLGARRRSRVTRGSCERGRFASPPCGVPSEGAAQTATRLT